MTATTTPWPNRSTARSRPSSSSSTDRGAPATPANIAIIDWIDWYNTVRLHSEIGDIPPVEHEADWYRHTHRPLLTRTPTNPRCTKPGVAQYLRWALIEAAVHAAHHPCYRHHYERTKRRCGKQRGAKIARVEIARKLATAIWHMLTRGEPFAPTGPDYSLVA